MSTFYSFMIFNDNVTTRLEYSTSILVSTHKVSASRKDHCIGTNIPLNFSAPVIPRSDLSLLSPRGRYFVPKASNLGSTMAEPTRLVARATSGAKVNEGPFTTSFVNFLMIGIPIIVGAIFLTCIGLCVWNRRKMRRKRAQEVALAMQPLPYEAGQDGVSTKT